MPEPTIHHTAIQAVWVKSSCVKTASRGFEELPGVSLGTCWGLLLAPLSC